MKTNIEHTHIVDFFEKIDFTFGEDIKSCKMRISENDELTEKLSDKVFVYDSPGEQIPTSFYVIATDLSPEHLFEVRRYIWNEDKYDLYFLFQNTKKTLFQNAKKTLSSTLCYAKSNPRKPKVTIASFRGNEADNEELEKIKKWNFDSGKFWLNYAEFLNKFEKKRARIDKKLIEQLKLLKTELKKCLKSQKGNTDEIVQSLIDRTLFIKFLEDNHIINSSFYQEYFIDDFPPNTRYEFKYLLQNDYNADAVNRLFNKINELFNNVLFRKPEVEPLHLTSEVLATIYNAIRQYNWQSKQLSLFDFRFDVVPVEFISHIYEVFLEGKQSEEGIYYTPPNLAHLIIDDTIKGLGTVFDPSCGSGMFLVLAFRKLLEYHPVSPKANVKEKINHKNELLKDYIFGIEKENTAWRLCLFSLYLEILKDIPPEEIKQFIEQKIKDDSLQPIFPHDFSDNIVEGNSLEIEADKKPHNDKSFDYMVGNPPFLELKKTDAEINFINKYQTEVNGEQLKAKDIIGKNQISQAFMLKIKDWAKAETRFGFVQNNSNFYNEKSEKFRRFFFKHYKVENFYELSRVKNLLFRKAQEGVVVTIFNNQPNEDNYVNYYPVDMEIFSKIFDLLIIQEDKKMDIAQSHILNGNAVLRDYLVGNKYDLKLIADIEQKSINFENFILNDTKDDFAVGLRITGSDKISAANAAHNLLSETDRRKAVAKKKTSFVSAKKTHKFNLPYIEYRDLSAFYTSVDKYISKDDLVNERYRRNKPLSFFEGSKILLRKIPKTKEGIAFFETAYSEQTLCFPDGVFSIRLNDDKYYHFLTAILNSELANYYINLVALKRKGSSNPHIGKTGIEHIPIPKYLDDDLVKEISTISQKLTKGKLQYEGSIKEKLNNLIYELYDLNILEIERIKHFFTEKRKVNHKDDLEEYRIALRETMEFFIENEFTIESSLETNLPFGLVVTAIYSNQTENTQPTSKKTLQYLINEILQKTDEKFLTMREMMFCDDCIYIIRNDNFHSWSATKAFEDGQRILKTLRK